MISERKEFHLRLGVSAVDYIAEKSLAETCYEGRDVDL